MGEFKNDDTKENKVIRMSKFKQVLNKVEQGEQQKKDERSNHDKLKKRNDKIIEIENEYNLPLITEIPKGKKSGHISVKVDAGMAERLSTLAAKSDEFNNKSGIVRAALNFVVPIFEKLYKDNESRKKAIGKDLYDLKEQTMAFQMDKKLLDIVTIGILEIVQAHDIDSINGKERDEKIKKAIKALPENLKKEGKQRAGLIKGGERDINDMCFYRQDD